MVLIVLGGCTSQTPGSPSEVPGGVPGATSTTAPGPSSGRPVSIAPCSLLSGADAKALGITDGGEADEIKGASSCLWRVEKPLAADSYSIDVTYYERRSVADLVTDHERVPVEVGDHKGVKALGDMDSGCIIALEVTATSRVDVRAIGGDSAGLCGVAMAAAELVEVRLP
ncbi:Protein of unknown function (DUF3558) [Actinokineospora diospyrosa]|uniref:DUF3558 domain-containing protein n=1 Tax=Actinokineospora diospyrosa TaxID=103728 RepID=A0ABT1IJY0_9PSEU|nr:Protein of unknown function (DUF3558) [Actinokineospora diospyrosa]